MPAHPNCVFRQRLVGSAAVAGASGTAGPALGSGKSTCAVVTLSDGRVLKGTTTKPIGMPANRLSYEAIARKSLLLAGTGDEVAAKGYEGFALTAAKQRQAAAAS